MILLRARSTRSPFRQWRTLAWSGEKQTDMAKIVANNDSLMILRALECNLSILSLIKIEKFAFRMLFYDHSNGLTDHLILGSFA